MSKLEITKARLVDAGVYVCRTSGLDITSFRVIVLDGKFAIRQVHCVVGIQRLNTSYSTLFYNTNFLLIDDWAKFRYLCTAIRCFNAILYLWEDLSDEYVAF